MNNQDHSPGSISPLHMENLFNQTLSNISSALNDREKVWLIAEFLESTRPLPANLTYSFHLQLAGLFLYLTANFQPDCCPPEELKIYLSASRYLQSRFVGQLEENLFRESQNNLYFYLALNHLYLGELEEGLTALLSRQKINNKSSSFSSEEDFKELKKELTPAIPEIRQNAQSNELMAQVLFDHLKKFAGLGQDLDLVMEKWKSFSGWRDDSIYCSLVESSGLLKSAERARIISLESRCRQSTAVESQNLVRFSNLPAFSKEEIYLSATDAMEAADFSINKHFRLTLPPCTLIFSFSEKNFRYSGESLGLPLALIAIAQKLLSAESRYHLSFSREAAFTGKIDLTGEIKPIEAEGLGLKIRAAFYSGIKYLVIPASNLKEARGVLFNLLSRHPWRKLELIPARTLEDVLNDSRITLKKIDSYARYLFRKKKFTMRKWFLGLLAAGLVISSFILINRNPSYHFWKIRHPVVLELHNGNLFARNQERQLLWVYRPSKPIVAESLQQKFEDLDGDGNPEILVSGNYKSDEKLRSEIFCFNKKGEVQWSFRPGKRIQTLTDEFSNHFIINRFEVAAFNQNSPEKKVLIIANHTTWYPTQITLLNSRGEILGEYWQAGRLGRDTLVIEDLDGDGWKEIILAGTNNDFQSACLLVLDPRAIIGCSPSSGNPEFQFKDLPPGKQEYYLLLPRTTINKVMGIRNYVTLVEISREDRTIDVTTSEYSSEMDCGMKYSFDFNLNPLLSRPADSLIEKTKELVISGLVPPHALTELRSLKDIIRYWDGEALVNYPVRNKKLNF